MTRLLLLPALLVVLALALPSSAAAFSFRSIETLEAMRAELKRSFPLGAPRSALDTTFREAGARHYAHPDLAGVDKWVYDINLCSLYVWRWNISANFDAGAALTQIFVNGEPVHGRGDKLRDAATVAAGNGKKQAIYEGRLPRPEASKGESVLSFIMFDVDTGSRKASDEFITGAGPTRADPRNLGKLHAYTTELWRSIFDGDRAKSVVDYAGDCP